MINQKNSFLYLLLIVIHFPLFQYAQPDLRFKRFNQTDGLSNPRVFTIFQDSKEFIWIGTRDGLNRYDGYEFKVYRNDPADSTSLSNNWIRSIAEDSIGNLWIATFGGGLNYYERSTGHFEHFRHDPNDSLSLSDDRVNVVYFDRANTLWVGTERGGLCRMKREKRGDFDRFMHVAGDTTTLPSNIVYSIHEDKNGTLWIGGIGFCRMNTTTFKVQRFDFRPLILAITSDRGANLYVGSLGGLFRLDAKTKMLKNIPLSNVGEYSLDNRAVSDVWIDQTNNQKWVSTGGRGLLLLDRNDEVIKRMKNKPLYNFTIGSDGVSHLLVDKQGNLWAGSWNGVNYLDFAFNRIKHFFHDPHEPNSLSSNNVFTFYEDAEQNLWIGTDFGLNKFDRRTGQIERFFMDDEQKKGYSSVTGIVQINERSLLVLTRYFTGISTIDIKTNEIKQQNIEYEGRSLHGWREPKILKTRNGDVWIVEGGGGGPNRGLWKWDLQTGQLNRYFPDPDNINTLLNSNMFCLMEDQDGFIWVGSLGGLTRFDPESEQFRIFFHDPTDTTTIDSDQVISLYEDNLGKIWVGTYQGLNLWDKENETFKRFSEKDGLASNRVMGIVQDDDGQMWVATNNGLTRLNLERDSFDTFDASDGLQGNFFQMGACYKSPSTGEIFVGGENGFSCFHPDNLKKKASPPTIELIRFLRYNKGNKEKSKRSPIIDEQIGTKKRIELSYQDHILEFEFAALNYAQPHKNQYAYRLLGFEDEWIYIGTKRSVSFTDLPAGSYTLQVKGANNDGIWNKEWVALDMVISPPWWKTWWAYVLYLLTLASITYVLYRFQLNKKLVESEARQLRELDQLKTRLYTNITHEFRTPLTVISGMADEAMNNPKKWFGEGLKMIKGNARQLLGLVNQFLDLSKLESGSLPVNLVQGDVALYLHHQLEAFHAFAGTRNIRLHFLSEPESLLMDYDPDKLHTILSNLLSNALKFTPDGGDIYLNIRALPDNWCQIRVRDTGRGIPADQLPYIFDRFYQVDNTSTRRAEGTGIGLALTKELVKLLGGSITVSSKLNKGSQFTVLLPITKEAPLSSPDATQLEIDAVEEYNAAFITSENRSTDSALPLALLIEDNADVQQYLTSCLRGKYQLVQAFNGREGIEKAMESIPDIIVSDVMMPEKDGFEVVETLKQDERTSHIPIILLTARADLESRLEGLESGADAYLAKPFDKAELEVRCRKLIESRRQMQSHYQTLSAAVKTSDTAVEEREAAFLAKLRQALEANLSDEDYGILHLCRELATSRAQLHRKLKALTGKSTSQVIRSIRLQKAKELLRNTDQNVSEVGYSVGFRNRSHFSQVFTEEFGLSPSDFRQKG